MQNCRQCNVAFEVADWDRKLLDQLSPKFGSRTYTIPDPTLCPQCRYQRRLTWRAELHLFKRKSTLTGETILSHFPPDSPYKAYTPEEWWSDKWDPMQYGRDFDFNRPFFAQFDELLHEVPLMALATLTNQNSDYINNASWCKDCYLIAGASKDESCMYCNYVNESKSCVDCSFVIESELCYECVDCRKCYNLKYSSNCDNCSDSYFLVNCRNCRNCFGCVNLYGKEYMFMNEQLTKEEYERRMANLQLHRRERIQEAQEFFEQHRLKFPMKAIKGELNENVTGNAVYESRNCQFVFDATHLEDCKYIAWFHQGKNCMDIFAWGFPGTEECYECYEVGDRSNRVLFSGTVWNGSNMMYCFQSHNSKHLFGCVGLRQKQYCIFNKQYTKEEYEVLVPRIIEHMTKNKEWGEFFPMSISPMAYNQTVAIDYLPISEAEAKKLGAKWGKEPPVEMPAKKVSLPDGIHEAEASICDEVLTCEATGKPYKIIPQEFQFYKQQGIPLPDVHWEIRNKKRLQKRNPRWLWDRQCAKCGTDIKTSFSPERPEIVYCEACYLKEVY